MIRPKYNWMSGRAWVFREKQVGVSKVYGRIEQRRKEVPVHVVVDQEGFLRRVALFLRVLFLFYSLRKSCLLYILYVFRPQET